MTAALGAVRAPALAQGGRHGRGPRVTLVLCLATAGQFLGGERAVRVRRRVARRRPLGARARPLRLRRPALGRLQRRLPAAQRGARPGHAAACAGSSTPSIPLYVFAMLLVVGLEQPRHPLDRRRADDAGVGLPRRLPQPRHVARGGVEVPHARAASASPSRSWARCCCSHPAQGAWAKACPALHWTRFMARAPAAASLHAEARRGLRADRVRHQGRPRPDAHLEARRLPRGALAGGRADGGGHAERRPLLPAARPPDREGRARARASPAACCSTLGLLSVLVATPFILIQWNLKRLLAYSSMEHVGIMAVGVGLGGEAATFGALLHMTYHTLAKPCRSSRRARWRSSTAPRTSTRSARDPRPRAGGERALRARGRDHHGVAALRDLLQRDD